MGEHSQANNKRIAKNTLLLYFRMLLIMAVSLYTSRVVLKSLGVEDFGIYNVVGGVVVMFQMLTGSLSTAISRYITFELGKGDIEKLKKIFATSINIQLILIAIVIIVMESIGLWYLNYKMVIPSDRLIAANWVLQFSVFTFSVNLLSIPYNAVIIAHEKMSAFAYISILEVCFKLGIAFAIFYNPFDKLIYYALLLLLSGLIIRLIYGYYSKKNFEEARWSFVMDKSLLKEMFGFAGWNFLGNTAYMLNTQGINLVLNSFFGVVVNAAVGITSQINNVVSQFASSFGMAINPQITKSYANDDKEYCFKLVCNGAKYSFLLMLCIVLPLILESKQILDIWLGDYPPETLVFVKWTLLGAFATTLGSTLLTLIQANGDIKNYQIYITLFGCLPFPLAWVVFKLGASAEWAFIIYFIVYYLLNFVRLFLVNRKTDVPFFIYIREAVFKTHIVAVLAFSLCSCVFYYMEESFIRLITIVISSVFSVLLFSYLFALNRSERMLLRGILQKIRNKFV